MSVFLFNYMAEGLLEHSPGFTKLPWVNIKNDPMAESLLEPIQLSPFLDSLSSSPRCVGPSSHGNNRYAHTQGNFVNPGLCSVCPSGKK